MRLSSVRRPSLVPDGSRKFAKTPVISRRHPVLVGFLALHIAVLASSPAWAQGGQTLSASTNVNMVGGPAKIENVRDPDGQVVHDHGRSVLQRQSEPSIAASSWNAQTLFAAANDTRLVDAPGVPPGLTGDAWLGVFVSRNGGRNWESTLLPGFLADGSPAGIASPLKGFDRHGRSHGAGRVEWPVLRQRRRVQPRRRESDRCGGRRREGRLAIHCCLQGRPGRQDAAVHPNRRRRQGHERAFSRQVLERRRHSAWPGQLHGVETGRRD